MTESYTVLTMYAAPFLHPGVHCLVFDLHPNRHPHRMHRESDLHSAHGRPRWRRKCMYSSPVFSRLLTFEILATVKIQSN